MRYVSLYRRPLLPVLSRYVSCVEWPRETLDALLPGDRWLGLKVLSDVRDISAIERMSNLEELSVGYQCSGAFRVDALPKLRELAVEIGPERHISPSGGGLLESVSLDRCTKQWAAWLESLPRLKHLDLCSPRSLPRKLPESLEVLDISMVKKWDIRGESLEGLSSLRELRLTGVRGMSDLSSFSSARQLECLYVEDCEELISTDGPGWKEGASARYVGRTPMFTFPPQEPGYGRIS